jgi:uncharacterized protein YndB with AHSA1/START domain
MKNTITHTIRYEHAPEAVWQYLTNSELLAQWLMPNDFQPIGGHEFTFRVNPMPAFQFDGIVYCKVLKIEPFKKLVYSWKGGPEKGKINLDTVVEWTLSAKDGGTEVFLEHTGFKDENLSILSVMDAGWLKNMKEISTLLTGANASAKGSCTTSEANQSK